MSQLDGDYVLDTLTDPSPEDLLLLPDDEPEELFDEEDYEVESNGVADWNTFVNEYEDYDDEESSYLSLRGRGAFAPLPRPCGKSSERTSCLSFSGY
jgi:hypothetical protein